MDSSGLFGLSLQSMAWSNGTSGQPMQFNLLLPYQKVMEVIFMRTSLKGMLFIPSSSVLIFYSCIKLCTWTICS